MTGARRFSLSSPDWGQAHLSLDAIVAYVDDELSPGAQTRAQEHLDGCGECRAEVGAQRQARAALRGAGGPCLPSSLLRSLRSIPVEAELPPMPPGLGVTADGQFVLLRDVPQADPGAGPEAHEHHIHTSACPGLPPAGLGPGPVAAPRRFSRRARIGVVSGLALSALAVGALAAPGGAPEPVAPSGVLGGVVLEVPPRLVPPPTDVPALATTADATSADPVATPAVLDARLRDRLNRIPAAFHPEP
jgi:anti-sigma factor RsiW